MIKLTCPSCNGMLELPDTLGVAHCMYCGTKILMQQPDVAKNKESVQRYRELCETALESKNYDEVIKFSNSILEIDTKDVDAWIYKAKATFWLTTEDHNRFDEAKQYIKKAEEIAPGDSRVSAGLEEIINSQVNWLIYLGKKKIEQGNDKRDVAYNAVYYSPLEEAENRLRKETECKYDYIVAMKYFVDADACSPNNINVVENIKELFEISDIYLKNGKKWIEWPDAVVQTLAKQHLFPMPEGSLWYKDIFDALTRLLKSKENSSFVIFYGRKNKKSVRYGYPLILDLSVEPLSPGEKERAAAFFLNLGISKPEVEDLLPINSHKRAISQRTFYKHDFGQDVKLATQSALAVFRQVYQFPITFDLDYDEE